MSETPITPSAAGRTAVTRDAPVRAAIARAAQATGVDFRFLMAQAKLESGLNPQAHAPTSSAAGLYQFTNSTWLSMLDRHGEQHGMGWAGAAIQGSRVADPALRGQLLNLRYDPDTAARMAAELAVENRASLQGVLGRAPDESELYLAHFMGQAGASRFLNALAADPGQSAPALFPREAAANRAIFYDNGSARTVGGVMNLLRSKVLQAMSDQDGGLDAGSAGGWGVGAGADFATAQALWANRMNAASAAAPVFEPHLQQAGFTAPQIPYEPVMESAGGPAHGPVATAFENARAEVGAGSRPISETLRSAFGGTNNAGGGNGLPPHIAAAYARLARFGL